MIDTMSHGAGNPRSLVFFMEGNQVHKYDRRAICNRGESYTGTVIAGTSVLLLFGTVGVYILAKTTNLMSEAGKAGDVWAGLTLGFLFMFVALGMSGLCIHKVIDIWRGRRHKRAENLRVARDTSAPLSRLIEALGEDTWKRVVREVAMQTDLGGALNYEIASLVDDAYATFINPENGIIVIDDVTSEQLDGMVAHTASAMSNLFNRDKARQHRRVEETNAINMAYQNNTRALSHRLAEIAASQLESATTN